MKMTSPEELFQPYEEVANSFDEVVTFIEQIRSDCNGTERAFAWRGVVNAAWALDSSLHRRLKWAAPGTSTPDEAALYKTEGRILKDVDRWGLHWHGGSRLPTLVQLAMLQHYGAPTRLIDISFNAWIGVWFAVEQKWNNTQEQWKDNDGRVFAVDVTKKIINEDIAMMKWPDELSPPWPAPATRYSTATPEQKQWVTSMFAWRPPPIDARIAAQNGGFLLGGVPHDQSASGRKFWPAPAGQHWDIDDVRRAVSVAARAHKLSRIGGGRPAQPLYTLRIRAAAKPLIRERLQQLFGYDHRTIYPDYSGFASFGTPWLKSGQ